MATVDELKTRLDQLTVEYDAAQDALKQYRNNNRLNDGISRTDYFSTVKQLENTVDSLANQRSLAARELYLAEQVQPTPPTTAGQTVNDDQSDGPLKPPPLEVGENGRIQRFPETTAPTNATPTETVSYADFDAGVDAETKTFQTTQGTSGYDEFGGRLLAEPTIPSAASISNNITPGAVPVFKLDQTYKSAEVGDALASTKKITSGGVGAKDDNVQTTSSPATTTTVINNGYNDNEEIKPQPNILDKFASYTYSASVYLMTPDQYTKLVVSKKKTVNGYNLLFQSGGAPNNVGGAKGTVGSQNGSASQTKGTASPDAGRNPFFADDFYIDNISITNALPGKVTQAAHMVSEMKFTVVEPNGITLIDRLYQAVQDHVPKGADGNINYTAVQYLMVIRWYGYDQNGKLIKVGANNGEVSTDPNAVVEKFIPFLIRRINWGVSSKLVTYEFDCAPVGQMIAATTARGTIPYDIELSDKTVGGILGGNHTLNSVAGTADDTTAASEANTTTPAPGKANAAPTTKKVVKQGLMAAMNDFQRQLVRDGIYEYPDEYSIVWANGAEPIRDADVRLPGKKANISATSMAPPATKDASGLDPKKTSVDNTVRNFAVTAGQQLVQAIDLTIRNSSFIYKQASIIKPEESVDETGEEEPSNTAATQKLTWFQISMECTPKSDQYDKKRNDYAYKIKYIISPYNVPAFDSKYFPVAKFGGLHKSYKYWFTGQNKDVLDYQANFNHMYNMTVSGSEPNNSAAAKLRQKYTSSMQNIPKYNFQSGSTESRSGAEGEGNEVAANAAESLYSPSDMGKTSLRIIGDPAWIQQGSQSAGVSAVNFNYKGFLPDGTINFDSQQVMFEIAWQRPADYNLNTGLADPYKGSKNRTPIESVVYQAVKCVSEFKQGKFEQTIEGSLYMYPIPATASPVSNAASNPKKTVNTNTSGGNERADTTPEVPTTEFSLVSEPPGADTTTNAPGVNAAESDDPEMLTLLNDEDPTDAYGENIGINGLDAPAVMNPATSAVLVATDENPFSGALVASDENPFPEEAPVTTVSAGQIGVTEA